MGEKKGIPQEILDRINIKKKEKAKILEVTPIIESHQIRLTIPSEIRREIKIKKEQKFKVIFNESKKEIIFKW